MIKLAIATALLAIACNARPNRACLLANNALKIERVQGSCDSVSLGESSDYAIWRFDDGERLCRDAVGSEHPLTCSIMQPTKTETLRDAKAAAEREAKLKIEAEAKARDDIAGAGSGSAKGAKKP